MTTLHEKIEAIPAGMWNCDMNGNAVDAYIPRWKAQEVAAEQDALVAQLVEALEKAQAAMRNIGRRDDSIDYEECTEARDAIDAALARAKEMQ